MEARARDDAAAHSSRWRWSRPRCRSWRSTGDLRALIGAVRAALSRRWLSPHSVLIIALSGPDDLDPVIRPSSWRFDPPTTGT